MTATIRRNTLVRELKKMVPAFEINPEWTGDREGDLGYLIINDLGRYLCQQACYPSSEELKRGLDFLESCLDNGDSYIRDLVTECLETLLSCEYAAEIVTRFGTKTHTLWEELMHRSR